MYMKNSKKVLLFDLTSAQKPRHGSKYGGMILYTTAVFYKLVELQRDDIIVKALFVPDNFIVQEILDFCRSHRIELVETTEAGIVDTVKRLKPDLYFTPNPTKNRIVDDSVKMLTVCHDIRTTEIYYDKLYWRFIGHWKEWVFLLDSILFKGYFQRQNMIKIARQYIGHDHIKFIAVSQHTRHHIIVHFPEYLKKEVPVFYSPMLENVGENQRESTVEDILKLGLEPQKFFFMDSGWRWSKNDLRAAIALDRIFTAQPQLDIKVAITGVQNPKTYHHYIKNKDRFVLLNYVERELLNALHKYAFATIYPTLGEGFGYTPMESFKYGVPVIAAANSSVMEVCGDAALYCNPKSIQEIQNRCCQFLDDDIYKFFASKAKPRYDYITSKQKLDLDEFIHYIYGLCLDK